MSAKMKFSLFLVTAMLVAACGGGGGGDADPGPGNNNPPGGNQPGGNQPPGGGDTVTEQKLRGDLALVANQLVYVRTNRTIYLPVGLDSFEDTRGIYDIASGSRGGEGGTDVPPTAVAPAAPIAVFGVRINRFVQPSTEGQDVTNQSALGRVALELTERADSPGSAGGAEVMRFVIDRVQLGTSASGEVVSASVGSGARMHVYGRNAAGTEVNETIDVPTGAVRLLPISEVPDNFGDTSSVVLLFDFESAFSQAGTRLAALEDISGHFNMNLTMSLADMVRPAAPATGSSPALERRDLVGQPITVGSQQAVAGGGISGNAWIRMYPPAD